MPKKKADVKKIPLGEDAPLDPDSKAAKKAVKEEVKEAQEEYGHSHPQEGFPV
jgi:hypothetical protein